jgi:hypothetical protein
LLLLLLTAIPRARDLVTQFHSNQWPIAICYLNRLLLLLDAIAIGPSRAFLQPITQGSSKIERRDKQTNTHTRHTQQIEINASSGNKPQQYPPQNTRIRDDAKKKT